MILMLFQAADADGFVHIAWWEYSKVLILLGLLVAGASWLVRNAGKLPGGRGGGAVGSMAVLAQLPLEPRKTIYLVRVGEEVLVVGAADNGLSLLKALPPGAVDLETQQEAIRTPSAFWTKLAELRRQP